MGALAADREALAVTKAAVAANVHKALDVLVALTAEVALNHDLVLIDIIADGVNLILGEVLNARIHVNVALDANLRRSGAADAVNVGQTDLNALLTQSPLLTLTLLMTGGLANDEDLAMAPNDFALIAHLLDRRTYLHRSSFR